MADFLMWFIWISFIFPISYIFTRKILKSSSTTHLAPGPTPLPVIGNLLVGGDKPHQSFALLAKVYGPVMSVKLGQVTTIVVSSPALANEVLHKQDQAFCNRWVPDAIRALRHSDVSVAWIRPVDRRWGNLRKICTTQLFTSKKLDANKDLRKKKVGELVTYLKERGMAQEPVDIGRAAFTTVLNMFSNTLFSVDMVDSYSESAQGFRELMRGIMEEAGRSNVSDLFPLLLRRLDLQGRRRRLEKHFARLHEIFDELIDQRLQHKKREKSVDEAVAKDFLETLVDYHVNGELDSLTMKSLLTDVFVAGSDTSSTMVEWAMAELLHSPSSMAKARAELREAVSEGTDMDESDILRLPYLQAVVKETLRLHPPVPFLLPRRTETSVELSGYTIPKNARVLVNAYAIGRDDNTWTDHPAEMFVPERFLGRDVEFKGRDFELIPFGAGRRICPGMPLANRVVHIVLASMLRWFEWKLPNGEKADDVNLDDKFGLTLALAVPIRAIPFPDS